MARPHVENGGTSSDMEVTENKLNKQSRTADRGRSSKLGVGEVLTTPTRKKYNIKKYTWARCFLWGQNNQEVKYPPLGSPGRGSFS